MASPALDADTITAIILAFAAIAAAVYAFRNFRTHPFRAVLAAIAAVAGLMLAWVFAFFQISLM